MDIRLEEVNRTKLRAFDPNSVALVSSFRQPSLNPAQVKMSMQMGARFMPDAGLVGGGTGSVNFAQAQKIAKQGLIVDREDTNAHAANLPWPIGNLDGHGRHHDPA